MVQHQPVVSEDEIVEAVMEFYDAINEGSTRNGPQDRSMYEYTVRRAILTMTTVGFRIVRADDE